MTNVRRAAFCSAILLSTTGAAADEFFSTRTEALVERGHDAVVTMHRSHADVVVRRTIYNAAHLSDQAVFFIDLPESAVATGLRTRAGSKWFSGDLLEAEAAAAKYKELVGIGGYYPKDPALLSWRSQRLLALQVFPCPPRAEKTVEYTLTIPTSYREGAYHVVFPKLGTEQLEARLTAVAAAGRDSLLVNGHAASEGRVLFPPPGTSQGRRKPPEDSTDEGASTEEQADLAVVPHDAPTLDGEVVTIPVGPRRVVTHYAVRAAPMLGQVPKGAYVAVVVDGSRSTADDFGKAARSAILAYLSHFKDARVEVFVFDRKITRLYAAFVPVQRALRDLTTWEPTRANGSDVDTALFAANQALSAASGKAPHRVVLVTDGLTRRSLTPERLRAAAVAGDAIVHVGLLSSGEPALSRNDDHAWGLAVRPTGGVVWNASAGYGNEVEARAIYEEWARPKRLDHLRLYSGDLALGTELETPNVIDEGEGHERLFFAERAVAWVRAEGELWSRPVAATFEADPAKQKLWAAAVFGSPLLDELTEAEMMPLARLGGAVSPVTSYLAIEPGVRPSTEGLDETGSGFGSGRPQVRMGATNMSGYILPIDQKQFLRDALSHAWSRCGGKADTSSVTLETTRAEVAQVDAQSSGDELRDRCLAEAAWALALPPQFNGEWETWTIDV